MRANTAFGQGNHCALFEVKAGVQSDDAVSRIAGGLSGCPDPLLARDLSAKPVQQWKIAPLDAGPIAGPARVVAEQYAYVFSNRLMLDERARHGAQGSNARDRPMRRPLGLQQGKGTSLPRLALVRAPTPICARGER